MPKRRALRPGTRGEEVIAGLIAAFLGYVAAEGLLRGYIHPLHWLTAIVVAMIVYFGTLLWYRWRYHQRPTAGQSQRIRTPWYRRWRGRRNE